MTIAQFLYKDNNWAELQNQGIEQPNFVLCFGQRELIEKGPQLDFIRSKYPDTTILSASTAGEISNESVEEGTIVATAVQFKSSSVKTCSVNLKDFKNSYVAGLELIKDFNKEQLKFVFVISDGNLVNGSELVEGINEILGKNIPVAGGLAGDSANFNKTIVGLNDDLNEGNIVAMGFYGEKLQVGFGSKGGWGQFGPERTITKSHDNILEEIDDRNALDLYKLYLGDEAKDLKRSSFYFPLSIIDGQTDNAIVRTILSIDEEKKTMTFAGNMPKGSKVRLMKSNTDNLLQAATEATANSIENLEEENILSILISCVGRKEVLNKRLEEELEAAHEGIQNKKPTFTGFYSYGEIAPFEGFLKCQLHNQTMTVTTFTEKE